MGKKSYRFKVGTFECIVVSDGINVYPSPAQILFVNAPQERLKQALYEHGLDLEQWTEWVNTYRALVIHTNRHRVLVDTGAGGYAPTTGNLIPNLRAEGIAPEDIDTVILTHAHPDHIGGNLDSEGKPAFPNARYVMWKEEWEFWTSELDPSDLPVDEHFAPILIAWARDNLPPIQGQLDLVDAEAEIVPGIRAVPVPRHTPGQIAVVASSGGEQLLYVSDAILHPIHLEQPDWYSAVDIAPEQALASKRRLLEWAAAEGILVHTSHFPFPGLGHIVQKGDAWQWQPTELV